MIFCILDLHALGPSVHPAAVLHDREKLRPAAGDFRKLAAARRALKEFRLRERGPALAE